MNTTRTWEKNGYGLRCVRPADADAMYRQNYCPLDPETARLTGSKTVFSEDEVQRFYRTSAAAADRIVFVLVAPGGELIGEAVLQDVDRSRRQADFRIAIFRPAERGKGLGTWAAEAVCGFAFEELKLQRLELNVFSFNPAAESVYQRLGFRQVSARPIAVADSGRGACDIRMALSAEEWRCRPLGGTG